VRRLLLALIGVACLAIAGYATGSALAQGGTSTSAGDQQYIDPLTSTTSKSSASSTTSSSQSQQSPSASGSTSTGSSSSGLAATTAASSSPDTAHSSAANLPFTGLNVEALIGVGLALLGGGVLLRLFLRRA